MPERSISPIPEWAQRERMQDVAWIGENLHLFWPVAQQGFERAGRGGIVTDTTTLVAHEGGKRHPYAYFAAEVFEEFYKEGLFSKEDLRLIWEYHPDSEFVAVLLKQGRESAYRIGVLSQKR